jgi:DNA-binding SARP family transcriptional activator
VHDLLPGNADPWAVAEHEAFHQLRLHALESLSLRLIAAGRLTEAVEAARLAVDGDPLRESAQRVLITAHLAAGQYGAARERYLNYGRLLRERLSLAPSPSFEELLGGDGMAG